LLALAEARARVDKGQLIRAAPSGGAPVKRDQPRSLNFPFLFEPSGALHERMSQYGECARRELGAREVAVCDRDGLFLYRSSLSSDEGGLEAALLVAVSDRVTRLFGLEGATAMQVADESGGWRCLIACVESGLFVGFSLVEPLDYGEVEIWSKALAEALPPAHFSPSEPPE